VLALISGGGSALLAAPAEGVTLAEKRALTSALLRSGAGIGEINCVRKHLSAIKGGRLAAAAWPASVLTLAISDVPGDDPAVIASGPTVADPTTAVDALKVLDFHGITIPAALRARLASVRWKRRSRATRGWRAANSAWSPARARCSKRRRPKRAGWDHAADPRRRDRRRGARGRQGAGRHGAQLRSARFPAEKPCVLLSGGETTVTLKGDNGRGGRNTEFLLGLALALDGAPVSMRWPPTPTASTARRTTPAPSSPRRRWPVPGRSASIRASAWRTTTPGAFSPRSATCW
jgi:glycerate 2-kinase